MKRVLFAVVTVLVLAGWAFGAGSSGTCNTGLLLGSSPYTQDDINANRWKYTCTFVSDDATGAIPNTTIVLNGYILRVELNPGTMTDNYDIALNSSQSVDIMGTALNNRDTTTSEGVYAYAQDAATIVFPYAFGTYTFVFTNNTATAQTLVVDIYVQR